MKLTKTLILRFNFVICAKKYGITEFHLVKKYPWKLKKCGTFSLTTIFVVVAGAENTQGKNAKKDPACKNCTLRYLTILHWTPQVGQNWLESESGPLYQFLKNAAILPSIKLNLRKRSYFILLYNCSTRTFLSHKLTNNCTFKKLRSVEVVTVTFEGSVDSTFERIGISLGEIEISACLKN